MSDPVMGVISGHWLKALKDASAPCRVKVSLDLGQSVVEVELDGEFVALPNGERLPIALLRETRFKPEDCFELRKDSLRKIYSFCGEIGRYYKLWHPKPDWPPTIVINNAPMHVVSECSPMEDTERKLDAVAGGGRRGGGDLAGARVFDTCFGLGYSALVAVRRRAAKVLTCEVDEHVLRIARRNPWSAPVFGNTAIEILNEDSAMIAADSSSESFDLIMHDPPTIALAGELYADALYHEFFRILKPGGKIYHYTGDPGGRLGRDLPGRVSSRLRSAGFKHVGKVWGGVCAQRPSDRAEPDGE